jgi:hypothetical protein
MKRGRGSAANPDFKRLKAKVGRKAPKPANVTDTSFKSASIRVASQSSQVGGDIDALDDASSHVLSGRGKALPELLDKLRNHPAGAVRLSSAKGLKDLIQRAIAATPPAAAAPSRTASTVTTATTTKAKGKGKRTTGAVAPAAAAASAATASIKNKDPPPPLPPAHTWLSTNLSTLIPAIARCALMDADDQVRSCGLDVLKLVVADQSSSSNSSSSMAPFVPLLLAHVSSALNSMDRSVRMDGAKAACPICDALQHKATPLVVSDAATSILPALVRLLKEQSFSVTTAAAAAATAGASSSSATFASSSGAKGGGDGAASSATGPKSRSGRRRHEETLMVLRAVLGVLRGVSRAAEDAKTVSTALTTTAGWAAMPAEPGGEIWNPTSLRIVTAGGSEQPTLFRNVADLSRMRRRSNLGSTYGGSCVDRPTSATAPPSTKPLLLVLDLLERLRDVLLDCGAGQSDAASALSSSVRSDAPGVEEAVNLVANILPLAVDMLPPPPASSSNPEQARTRKVLSMILSSLVRFVPMQHGRDQDGVAFSASVQAQICLAIVAVDTALSEQPRGTRDQHRPVSASSSETPSGAADASLPYDAVMPAVVEYAIASLRSIGSDATEEVNMSMGVSSPFRSHPHSSVLQLLKNLLESERPAVSAHRTRILREFVLAFFFFGDGSATSHPDANLSPDATGAPNDNKAGSAHEWQRSAAVRRALTLARRVIFVPHRYELGWENIAAAVREEARAAPPSVDENCLGWAARRVLRCTPRLLVSWRADFIGDSYAALVLLQEVVRRLPLSSHSGTGGVEISLYIAESLAPILEARRCEGLGGLHGEGITACTFELYPESLQQVTLGIFVLLGRLPGPALAALGAICSRSHMPRQQHALSLRMAATVMETVHSIRKRLSMRDYLGFVLEASGVLNIHGAEQEPATGECEPEATELPMPRAMALDRALQVACRLLVECGPAAKVLSMLWPLLLSYLTAVGDRSTRAREDLLKARTAITIVACLLSFSDGALILDDSRDDADMLARSVARFCRTAFAVAEEDDPHVPSFVRPAVTLIAIPQMNLLPAIFRRTLSRDAASSSINATSRPSSAFQSLHHLVRSAELREVVAECACELKEIVRSCDLSTPANDAREGALNPYGPNQIWFGRLVAELEAAQARGEAPSNSVAAH